MLFKKIFNNFFSKKYESPFKDKLLQEQVKNFYKEKYPDILLSNCYHFFPLYMFIKHNIENNKKYKGLFISNAYHFLYVYENIKQEFSKEDLETCENIFKNVLFINMSAYRNLNMLTRSNLEFYEHCMISNELFLKEKFNIIQEQTRIKKEIEHF